MKARETMTIHLNIRDIARAALARYKAGTLSAQAPTPECVYRSEDGVYACGIGAGLSDADIAALKKANKGRQMGDFNSTRFDMLDGWDTTSDNVTIGEFQQAHDLWGNRAREMRERTEGSAFYSQELTRVEQARDAFLAEARRLADLPD